MNYLLPEDIAATLDRFAADPRLVVTPLAGGELGRCLRVVTVGAGPRHIAIKANAHADEPAGCVTCARLTDELAAGDPLLEEVTFHLLLTANPRGLERNRRWMATGEPPLATWFRHVYRDPPESDREFGYGERPKLARHVECAAWHRYLDRLPRLDGYASLHSMAFAGGAWFLVQLDDRERRRPLLDELTSGALALGLPLHDEDRGGRKGFHRLGPGFCTAPTYEEMQAFFAAGGGPDPGLRLNSMQVARRRHGTPVALVSELPLYRIEGLADMTPTARSRREVDRALSERLAASLAELAELPAHDEVAQEASHRAASARALGALADQWGDRPAAARDELSAELQVARAWLTNAALALRLPGADSVWVERLAERVAALEQRFAPQTVPLAVQVAAQAKLVRSLAGHLVEDGA